MGEMDLELRKRPVQERAQRRFAAILDAGRTKLAAVGVDVTVQARVNTFGQA